MNNQVTCLILLSLTLFSCGKKEGVTYGKPVTLKKTISIDRLYTRPAPDDFAIEGKIVQIDTARGSWFILEDDDDKIEISLTEFVIPQDAKGKRALVQGTKLVKAYRRSASGQDYETFVVYASGMEIY
ncbi:hypothetical protein F9K33_12545 [bacterium]|nr:MAG: hypothetical protein F9K33_12545 [bacterium]